MSRIGSTMCKLLFPIVAMLGTATGQFIEEHTLRLPTLFAVASVVLPATWWISWKFTKIEDQIQSLKDQVEKLTDKKKHDSH